MPDPGFGTWETVDVAKVFFLPVVDENQLDQDLRYLDIGKSEGARLHWGGERLNRENPGFYLQPALFTEATNQMRIAREEIFGPVAAVICVRDYEEALTTANDTPFGLSAGIATTRRAFPKFESYGMLETAAFRGWKAQDAIEWFLGIGRLGFVRGS